MGVEEAAMWGQQAILAVLAVSGPVMLVALLVGGFVSILQAVTQVHEMTLVFVPKIAAVFIVIYLMGGWMLAQATAFATRAFEAAATVR